MKTSDGANTSGVRVGKGVVGKNPQDTAIRMLSAGLWPIPLNPRGAMIPGKDKASEGKDPIGKGWGLKRNTTDSIRARFKQVKNAGIGVGLGPDRGPGGTWLIDVEGDGPEAEESRLRLFDGQVVETLGWGSARGGHQLLTADPVRIAALLPGIAGLEIKGTPSPGVYHLPAFPGLEIRFGGTKANGVVKQVQSVFPPTVGTDGKPRQWNGVSTIAEAPESLYEALATAGQKPESVPAPSPKPEPFVVPAAKNGKSHQMDDLELAADALKSLGSSFVDDYQPWLNVGFSLRKLGSEGLDLWDNWSRGSQKYRPGACAEKWPTMANEGITLAWLFTRAKESGWSFPKTRRQGTNGNGHERSEVGSVGSVGTPRGDISKNGHSEQGSVGSVGDPVQEYPKFEGAPQPLTTDLLPVLPLPAGLLPNAFRPWLIDIANRGCFPLEYPTASALVATGSLIGRSLAIRPKRHDSWTVVPNLWGTAVGPPGLQKTPAVEETFLPLRRLVAEAIEAHIEAERRALEDATVIEAKAGAAKKRLAESAKKGAPDEVLRQLAAAANPPEGDLEVKAKRYVVNDATVEKLGELLRENPRGLLQFRDELSGWLKSMDRQGHESDRGFYLESWNGNGSYTFDRIGRGTVHVNALCLSIFGTIQPGPLSRYLKGAAAGEDADGFIPRFQVLVYPDAPSQFVNVDAWPDTEAKNRAFEVFRWIDSMNAAELGAELDEDRGLRFLRFDDDAQAVFDEWRVALENRLRDGSESTLLICHLAKYRSLMPSLALLFHVIDSVGTYRFDPVSKLATERAAAWCELLESHARRVYQSASEGDPEAAARLAERIKQSLPNPFTFRQVAVKGWAGLDNVDDVRKAVGLLEDRNWAKVVTRPPGPQGGRPSEEVWVNPALHRDKEGIL